jgi:small subunit ribosomal protein S6
MSIYEHVCMVRGDLPQNQIDSINVKIQEIIEKFSGKILKKELWGIRNLAYPINKHKRASYTMFNFEVSPDGLKELERVLRVNENVIRYLTMKIEAVDPNPSFIIKAMNNAERTNDRPGSNYNNNRNRNYVRDDSYSSNYKVSKVVEEVSETE